MEVVFCSETLVYGIVTNKTITVLKIVFAILCWTTTRFRVQWIWGKGQFMCETRPSVLISIQQVETNRNIHACCASSWWSAPNWTIGPPTAPSPSCRYLTLRMHGKSCNLLTETALCQFQRNSSHVSPVVGLTMLLIIQSISCRFVGRLMYWKESGAERSRGPQGTVAVL